MPKYVDSAGVAYLWNKLKEDSSSSGGGTTDYNDLTNKPQINGHTLRNNQTGAQLGLISQADLSDKLEALGIRPSAIYFDTVEGWNSNPSLRSEENAIYVYTDYQTVDNQNIAGFKIGDGNAYVYDMPFTDTLLQRHIANTTIHITQAEREFWNNKSRAYMSLTQDENLILAID